MNPSPAMKAWYPPVPGAGSPWEGYAPYRARQPQEEIGATGNVEASQVVAASPACLRRTSRLHTGAD